MILVPCELPPDVEGYYVYATGEADQAWIVFTVLWFDARCGVTRRDRITGWSVAAGQA